MFGFLFRVNGTTGLLGKNNTQQMCPNKAKSTVIGRYIIKKLKVKSG